MNRKIKHKKLKNTGLLYEFLIRQATTDVLKGNTPVSINLIKKYFKKDSALHEELRLYNTLLNKKIEDSNFALKIIDAAIASKKTIDQDELNKSKYNLVKEINTKYSGDLFFKTKIDNYQIYASICNLLEYTEDYNPNDYTKNKLTIAENILKKQTQESTSKKINQEIDPQLKALTFKILIEKFNNKWDFLSKEQKQLLRHFIHNSVDSEESRKFIKENVKNLKVNFNVFIKNTDDQVLKIKLQEVTKLLDKIDNSTFITESQYLTLVKYYELLKEIKQK